MVRAPVLTAHKPLGLPAVMHGERGASQRPKRVPIDFPRKRESWPSTPRPNKNTNAPPARFGGRWCR